MMPKIKSDKHGLYVRVDGYVCRPFIDSAHKEGADVRGSHPPGSSVRVTNKVSGEVEFWFITVAHWWHPVEGRGPASVKLRQCSRERFPKHYPGEKDWQSYEDFAIKEKEREAQLHAKLHRKVARGKQ